MGACVCRANPDNETMSVSSASISRPASAGEWPSPCLLYIRLYSACTYTYSRHRHGRCAQEPTALPRDHPVAIGRPTHRGAAEVQEGRVLGHGARLWWPQGDLGCAAGGHQRGRGPRLSDGAGHPGRGQCLSSEWVSWSWQTWPGRFGRTRVKVFDV